MRITASYAARSFSFSVVRRAGGLVGKDQLVPAVEPVEDGGGDVVGAERSVRDQAADHLRRPRSSAPRMFSIRLVRKYDGQTTEQRTPYSASSWPAVSLNATTAAFTAL